MLDNWKYCIWYCDGHDDDSTSDNDDGGGGSGDDNDDNAATYPISFSSQCFKQYAQRRHWIQLRGRNGLLAVSSLEFKYVRYKLLKESL